ncbi:unnamed protein product [Euphydryas editha]|uniref:Endonuclease/exonuclease/phosphatase domain-containing protein n=1 Tax=Euphydryas editha TaxID=104508 RepID=A0AAU9TT77_EUPED|nr:unnamed protein product [Euphydryas editha]
MIVFTETWLNSSISDNELFDDRYSIYRRDRESSGFHNKKMGGGVLIAVSKRFKSYRLCERESDCEDLWVRVELGVINETVSYLNICGVYIPPPVKKHVLEHFIANANNNLEKFAGETLILGDFNLSSINWNKTNSLALKPETSNSQLNSSLIDFMALNNLNQYNSCLNNKNRLLDLIMSSVNFSSINICADPLSVIDPLHPPIEFCVTLDRYSNLQFNGEPRFLFHKADYTKIIADLCSISWENEFLRCVNVDEMLEQFYMLLRSVITKHVPKSNPCRGKKYPIWFSAALIKTIKEKFKYRTKHRKYCNPRDLLCFELLRDRCAKLHNLNYKTYLRRLESSLVSNPKLIWSFLKHKRGGSSGCPARVSSDTELATTGSDICDLFASQFSSIYNTEKISISDEISVPPVYSYILNISVTKDQDKYTKSDCK